MGVFGLHFTFNFVDFSMSFRGARFKFPLVLFRHYNLKSHCRLYASSAFSHPCSLLQSCRDIGHLKRLHAHLLISYLSEQSPFASELASSYAEFGDFVSSLSVLRSMTESRTRLWNSMIKSCADLSSLDWVIRFYVEMRRSGVEPDSFTLPLVNHAMSKLGIDVSCGEMMHCVGIVLGFGSDIYFCNTLIEVYVKCGNVGLARKVFDDMPHTDLVSWTSLISGYNSNGNAFRAFQIFNKMKVEVDPNSVTMITMLQACLCCSSVAQGNQLHCYLLKAGFLNDVSVRNSLLNVYGNLANTMDVENLFDEFVQRDAIAWNILISFHISKGDVVVAMDRFNEMLRDVKPRAETVTIVAAALSMSRFPDLSQQLHCLALKYGFHDHALLTCLLNLYAKHGALDSAVRLFSELPCENPIAWSSMMASFIGHGRHDKAIELFKQIQAAGLQDKPQIIETLLNGYADLGALQKGKEIHAYFLRNISMNSSQTCSIFETSILNMYAKCGSISSARNCFNSMETRDLIAWTSMIEGLGTYGLGLEALELFDQMLMEGISPNSVTFLSLLAACAHAGLEAEGCMIFNAMKWRFGIEPELHHYTSVVDLLGRAGRLREALCVTLKMPCRADGRIWGALLAASRTFMERKVGEYAAKRLMEVEPENVGYQVVLSNMKAGDEEWSEVETVRRIVSGMDLKKVPGWSSIEANGRIQGFMAGDRLHPEFGEISGVLRFLGREIQNLGMYSFEQMIS